MKLITADAARQLSVAGAAAQYDFQISYILEQIEEACRVGKNYVAFQYVSLVKLQAAESLTKHGFKVDISTGHGNSKHLHISW